jgi:ElaB/YqjD/DUF883 family membrane-anchored ribosome-binding protein
MTKLRVDEMSDDELRREVRERRAHVAADVEALTDKLTRENLQREATEAARHMKDEMMDKARENVRARAMHVRAGVRDNPWPYALIAGGIGWLLVDRYVTHAYTPRLDAARVRTRDAAHRAADTMRHAGERVVGRSGNGNGASGDEEGRFRHLRQRADSSIRDLRAGADARYQSAKHRASLKAHDARIAAMDLRDRSEVMARDAGARARGYYDDHPLAVGGMALALGVGLGLLLPTSQREVAWMGERSDELKRRALDLGHELKSDVTEIARTTAQKSVEVAKETARAEAHSHHLDDPMTKLGLEGGERRQEGQEAKVPSTKPGGGSGEPTSSGNW